MAGSAVDKGKKALEDSAFKLSKSFLTGITEQINGAVEQLNDIAKNIGAVFQRPNKGKSEKKQRVPSFDWSNEYPVIYGGYGVTINGKELGTERLSYITDLEIQQNVGVDTCDFTVVDPNFYFIEDNIFVRDTPIQASITLLGVPTSMSKELPKIYFDGYISNVDIEFTQDAAPVLHISCVDKTHEMNKKRWKRAWENVNSAQVVEIIAKEMGYQCYIEPDYPFPIQKAIIQDTKTNIEFLEELAGKELDLFVVNLVTNQSDGKTILYYVIKGHIDKEKYCSLGYMVSNHRAKGLEEKDKMQYDVIRFSPRINVEQRKEEIQNYGINSDTKGIESDLTFPEPPVESQSESSDEGSNGGNSSGDSDYVQTVG